MNTFKYRLAPVLILAACFAGCTTEPIKSPPPISFTGINKTHAMSVAEDVLTGMQFTIEKADVEKGYIKTKPLRGGQIFEIWRQDNASAVDALESSIQSIQRTAELNIVEVDSTVKIMCHVSVRRLSLPENDYVTQSRAAAMFTSSSSNLQKLEVNPEQSRTMEWVPLGPDPALETRIMQRIEKKLSESGS